MSKQLYIDPSAVRAPGSIHFEDIPVNRYQKTVRDEAGNFTKEQLVDIYRDMLTHARVRDDDQPHQDDGEYEGIAYNHPGPAHLSMGQEAAAVGEAFHLDVDDFIFGSHRSHSRHTRQGAIGASKSCPTSRLIGIMTRLFWAARRSPPSERQPHDTVKDLAIDFLLYGAMAEIFARENGFNRGLGGSMHTFFTPFGIYPEQRHRRRLRRDRHRRGAVQAREPQAGHRRRQHRRRRARARPGARGAQLGRHGPADGAVAGRHEGRPAGDVQHRQQPVRHGRPDPGRDHGLRRARAAGRGFPQPDAWPSASTAATRWP